MEEPREYSDPMKLIDERLSVILKRFKVCSAAGLLWAAHKVLDIHCRDLTEHLSMLKKWEREKLQIRFGLM